MNKKDLSERDICTKFITPALRQAGWDELTQLREEVSFTKGRIIVRGKLVTRGKAKRADYILYYKPNIPLAVIEAKDNECSVGDGIQQALGYAETLQIPFVFSSNGDGFVFHDRTATGGAIESNLQLHEFPSPATLWARYREWKRLPPEAEPVVLQDYYSDGSEKGPRYYQASAVNASIEAVAKGQNRQLLVMATGTGKTYTAFQIIWRLWKAGRKKRILFLVDRDLLANRIAKLREAGLEKIAFAWAGEAERGKKHYYRIQGPTFLVEHDNSQNDGNHVHSIWRDFAGDFGRDILREHIARAH